MFCTQIYFDIGTICCIALVHHCHVSDRDGRLNSHSKESSLNALDSNIYQEDQRVTKIRSFPSCFHHASLLPKYDIVDLGNYVQFQEQYNYNGICIQNLQKQFDWPNMTWYQKFGLMENSRIWQFHDFQLADFAITQIFLVRNSFESVCTFTRDN